MAPDLKINDYFELTIGGILQPYRITGFDVQSTEGVEFVSADPVYEYDKNSNPVRPEGGSSKDYGWLDGNFEGV